MSRSSTKPLLSGLAIAAVCLAAAACTRADDATGTSLEQTIAVPQAAAGARDAMALAPARVSHRVPLATLPPEAGRIVGVRVHDYVDGLRQEIALGGGLPNGARNSITILACTSRQPTLDEAVPLEKPTEAAIRSEIGGAFPHQPMQVVDRESANAYGPYGLALGRAGGDTRCLFMWQWIDANRLPPDAGVAGPVSVRVRLCQAGTSFDAMAALVDRLTIGGAPAEVATLDDETPRRKHRVAAHHVRRPHVAQRPSSDSGEPAETVVTKMHYKIAPPLDAPSSAPARASVASLPPASMSSDLPPEALRGPQRGASKPE